MAGSLVELRERLGLGGIDHPVATCERSTTDELGDEIVVAEAIVVDEPAAAVGPRRGAHLGNLRGRGCEPDIGRPEADVGRVDPLDRCRGGPAPRRERWVARREASLPHGDHCRQRQAKTLVPALDDTSGDQRFALDGQ